MNKILCLLLAFFLCSCNKQEVDFPSPGTNGYVINELLKSYVNHLNLRSSNYCPADGITRDNKDFDIGSDCTSALKLGSIGDACSSLETQKIITGTLNYDDIDLMSINFVDKGSLFCDVLSDSFHASITLSTAPAGVVLCVKNEEHNKCSLRDLSFDPNYCRGTKWSSPGSFITNNSQTLSFWIRRHPQAPPQCLAYKVVLKSTFS